MRSLIWCLILVFSIPAWADDHCYPQISRQEFEKTVQDVRKIYFPILKDMETSVSTFSSNAYFLQAQPVIKTLFKNANPVNTVFSSIRNY